MIKNIQNMQKMIKNMHIFFLNYFLHIIFFNRKFIDC